MVCNAPYLQNKFRDPQFFFYVLNIILSFSTHSHSFKKVCTWELLGANVLKLLHWTSNRLDLPPEAFTAFCWETTGLISQLFQFFRKSTLLALFVFKSKM